MKISLEFDSLEELDETLKGMSAGLFYWETTFPQECYAVNLMAQ